MFQCLLHPEGRHPSLCARSTSPASGLWSVRPRQRHAATARASPKAPSTREIPGAEPALCVLNMTSGFARSATVESAVRQSLGVRAKIDLGPRVVRIICPKPSRGRRNSRMDWVSRRQVVPVPRAAAVTLGPPVRPNRINKSFASWRKLIRVLDPSDHRLHHAQSRLPCLRHSVRHGREPSDQTADGRSNRRLSRRSEVYVHATRRP